MILKSICIANIDLSYIENFFGLKFEDFKHALETKNDLIEMVTRNECKIWCNKGKRIELRTFSLNTDITREIIYNSLLVITRAFVRDQFTKVLKTKWNLIGQKLNKSIDDISILLFNIKEVCSTLTKNGERCIRELRNIIVHIDRVRFDAIKQDENFIFIDTYGNTYNGKTKHLIKARNWEKFVKELLYEN